MSAEKSTPKGILSFFSRSQKRDHPSTSSSEEGTVSKTKSAKTEDMAGVQKDLLRDFDDLLEDEQQMEGVVGEFERHLESCFKDFRTNIVGKLKSVLSGMNDKIKNFEARIQRLEQQKGGIDSEELQNIQIQVNRNHQYSRKDNLRIFEKEELPDEDTKQVVCDLVNVKLNVKIKPSDISAAHRLPKSKPSKKKGKKQRKEQKHRPIIVRLKGRGLRQEILKARKKLKGSGVSIAEDMTAANYALMKDAEASQCFKSVWFANGKVRAEDEQKKVHTLEIFDKFRELV